MSPAQQPDDDSHIADTGMFQRFVEHEEKMEDSRGFGGSKGRWIAIGAIVVIIVIAVVIFALTR